MALCSVAVPLFAFAAPPPSRLCSSAVQAVEEQARRQALEVAVECRREEANTPENEAALVTVAQALSSLRTGPMQIVLRVQSRGARPTLTALTVDLRVRSQAWLISKDLSAGERVQAADLIQQSYEWPAGVAPQVARADRPQGRTKHAIRGGMPVTQSDLMSDQEVSRGEAVTALVLQGELSLSLPARVTRNAKVGEPVQAQLEGRRDVVEGVLVDVGTVLVGARIQ